jgi:hypothetical protein
MSYITTSRNAYANEWSNAIAEPIRIEASAAIGQPQQVQAHYDRAVDVLSITVRQGEPKYVVVGRGTVAIFADEWGIWAIDIEAESWDDDVDAVFPLMKIEVW